MTVAEGAQEIGRVGVIKAKRLLQQILGEAIDLPFNAYDHPNRLAFQEQGDGNRSFLFDLGGVLKRRNSDSFDHQEAVEVFAEVKTRTVAGDLLAEYKDFLRRAATASADSRYANARFVFYSTIPFGSSRGSDLVDGELVKECASGWPDGLQRLASSLHERIVLIIAPDSFVRLVSDWGRNAA